MLPLSGRGQAVTVRWSTEGKTGDTGDAALKFFGDTGDAALSTFLSHTSSLQRMCARH